MSEKLGLKYPNHSDRAYPYELSMEWRWTEEENKVKGIDGITILKRILRKEDMNYNTAVQRETICELLW
jgi:hypothetical protein